MILNGAELAGYIKERQAKAVRRLRQAHGLIPKLAILQASDDPAINTYVRLKQRYGEDIGAEVDIVKTDQTSLLNKVKQYNADKSVCGIILQLPIPDDTRLEEILTTIEPQKDVDGLNKRSDFESASATAILWLLAGYGIELRDKQIIVVGQGRLVGAPLSDMLERAGHKIIRCDSNTKNLSDQVGQADILISATGTPRLIKSDWVKAGAVVIDAGTASEQGEIVGDLDDRVYERTDITLTPKKGGVGPLTVCSLFENLIRATQIIAQPKTKN